MNKIWQNKSRKITNKQLIFLAIITFFSNYDVVKAQIIPDNTLGSEVSAFTEGEGNAGSITINSPQFVNIEPNSKIIVETRGSSKPGNINITTDMLTIGENAQLSATATETATNLEGGGSINLYTQNLNIAGQLGIFAETQGQTPAGNLTINPNHNKPNLNINFTDNGFISASTTASGDGGNITLTAPDTINIQGLGKISTETSGSGNAGSINITTQQLNLKNGVEITASTRNSTGNGGDITINSPILNLENKAAIAVSSAGLGKGGDINITTNQLNLEHSNITGETRSTDGGNITLNIKDLLFLKDSSNITSTAGTAQAGGNGGNIVINAPFIISYPSNPVNNIIANAYAGNGGNINITTNTIFGSEYLTIEASSQLGLDGEVIINNLEVDPTSGLIEIAANFIDAESLVAKNPCAFKDKKIAGGSSFIIKGKGGIPSTPEESSNDSNWLLEWATPETKEKESKIEKSVVIVRERDKKEEIVWQQAQGWLVNRERKIVLTSKPTTEITSQTPYLIHPSCNNPIPSSL